MQVSEVLTKKKSQTRRTAGRVVMYMYVFVYVYVYVYLAAQLRERFLSNRSKTSQ